MNGSTYRGEKVTPSPTAAIPSAVAILSTTSIGGACPFGSAAVIRINPLAYFTTAFFTTATADPLPRQDGNVKASLRVAYGPTSGWWEFAVVTKNITNVKTASYRNPLTGGNGAVYALPDRARSVALQFTIHN